MERELDDVKTMQQQFCNPTHAYRLIRYSAANVICTRDNMGSFGPSAYYNICYKNALHLNRYNFRTINAIDFLFSTLHSTPFLYVDLYFRVLHKLRANVMRPDYPWGLKLPHLQVGASNSFQIHCVCRGVLSLLNFSVR